MTVILNKLRGTLIETTVEYENGKYLRLQPLAMDASLIVFGAKGMAEVKSEFTCEEGTVVVFNDDMAPVGLYQVKSNPVKFENVVLYPDGQVWGGSVHEPEESPLLWILKESAIKNLKDPSGASFDPDDDGNLPTILVRLDGDYERKCGGHRCGRCFLAGKIIKNGLS